jgi:hypothetical protein
VDEALALAAAGQVLYGGPSPGPVAKLKPQSGQLEAQSAVASAFAPAPVAVPAIPARGTGGAKSAPPSTPPPGGSSVGSTPKAPRKRKRKPAPAPPAPPPSESLAYAFEYDPPGRSLGSGEDCEDDVDVPGPSRRRVAHPENWARNIKKPRLEPLVSEKAPCSCSLRCYQRIGRDKRKTVRATFQALARPQQKIYMRALIVLNKVKSKGAAMQMGRRRRLRSFTAEYHLKVGGRRYRVCLKAFQAILGVGSKQIKLLNSHAWAHPHGALR